MIIPSRAFKAASAPYLSFDGSSDNVIIPHSSLYAPASGKFSINVWVYPVDNFNREGGTRQFICFKLNPTLNQRQFFLEIGHASYNDVRFIYYGSLSVGETRDSFSGGTLQKNQWQNIHVDIDITGATTAGNIYINNSGAGITWEKRLNISSFPNSSRNLYLGNSEAGTSCFGGRMSNLRFFNRILSASERYHVINKYLTGREKGLISNYPFLDGSGSTLKDWSNNANNGTITGATWG